jgi:hypothetical protein
MVEQMLFTWAGASGQPVNRRSSWVTSVYLVLS